MTEIYTIYSAAAAMVMILLWGDLLRRRTAEYVDRRHAAPLRDRCLRMIVQSDGSADGALPPIRRRSERMRLAEVLAELAATTDVAARSRTDSIVAAYGLDRLVLRRIRLASGYRRALWLLRLARLNPRPETAQAVRRYSSSRNRNVRFCTLLCAIAAEPLRSLHTVACWGDTLSRFETAQIVTLIFRGRMPVACTPLLTSPHDNLRMLGLGVVRRIGADETFPILLNIASSDPDRRIAREAMYTLCALHLPLDCRDVVRAMAMMPAAERKSLYRFMAFEGYSVRALSELFREQERQYFESLVESYKCRIPCPR
ncbi:MAG: hypothetical protein K2J51_10025 [Alistipes sp.]|nr:hypothetical protein [Alistipes sp.]